MVGCFARFGFHLADDASHVVARIKLYGVQQSLPRLLDCHLRDALKLLQDIRCRLFDFILFFIEPALTLVQLLVALFQAFHTLVKFVAPALNTFVFVIQIAAAAA